MIFLTAISMKGAIQSPSYPISVSDSGFFAASVSLTALRAPGEQAHHVRCAGGVHAGRLRDAGGWVLSRGLCLVRAGEELAGRLSRRALALTLTFPVRTYRKLVNFCC